MQSEKENNQTLINLLETLNERLLENAKATEKLGLLLHRSFKAKSIEDIQINTGENKTFSKEQVMVYIRIVFLKLGEIDTLKEQFQAEVYIEARWNEPDLKKKNLDYFNPQNYWNPKIFIENAVGDVKEEISYKAVYNETTDTSTIYEIRKLHGVFLENLELYDFPDLSITITSNRTSEEICLSEDPEYFSSINTNAFIDQQEWELHKHIRTSCKLLTKEYSVNKMSYPSISFTCHASRRPGYFYWNVYLLILFITLMAFATFSVNPTLPQNRLQLAFTLLLTSVTFKWVINRSLPTISYLTSLDKYVLISMILLCIICVWHAFCPVLDELYNTDTMEIYDRYALYGLAGFYVLFHLIFAIWMRAVVYKRRIEMYRSDKRHLEFLVSRQKNLSAILANQSDAGKNTINVLPANEVNCKNGNTDKDNNIDANGNGNVVYYRDNTQSRKSVSNYREHSKENSEIQNELRLNL